MAWVFIAFYLYWKWAHTYYVKENGVLITRSWIFGTYQREITFDKIQDVHVRQGIIAKAFKCGSVVFVTATGLEVGYVGQVLGSEVLVLAAPHPYSSQAHTTRSWTCTPQKM